MAGSGAVHDAVHERLRDSRDASAAEDGRLTAVGTRLLEWIRRSRYAQNCEIAATDE